MATISITSELDVLSKYNTLVKESLASDSVYIRAKETIQELFTDGYITTAEKAAIIGNVISQVVSTITTSGMSTALQWATAEKELALKKLELELQLDILAQEGLLKEAQVEQIYNTIRLAKVESKRLYGTPIFIENDLASLGDDGKIYAEIQLVEKQTVKINKETDLVVQKISESEAAVHKIVADTYVNSGIYTYTGLSSTGITGVIPHHGDHITLSATQKMIAIEQAKGYTYSAWANALTGSASMLGTAMAAEYDAFGTGELGDTLLNVITSVAKNLKGASGNALVATPTY